MADQHHCGVCGAAALEKIPGYATLPRATSDSRPWPSGGTLVVCTHCGAIQKLPDSQWLNEIKRIYGNYDIYHQSAGSEHLIFSDRGGAEPRSKRLVEYLLQQVPPCDRGRLLDIGCGNGAALRSYSEALPDWDLYGTELSTATLETLCQIRNFNQLFVGPLSEIKQRFSVVSLIHTLEHMRSAREALSTASHLLAAEGMMFVEVPDIETSPFDLLVADHLFHFSRATLGLLVARCGLSALTLTNEVIFKEITLVAQCGHSDPIVPAPEHGIRIAKTTIAWLDDLMAVVEDALSTGSIGIFGTAVAGMALYGAFKDRVAFFVDEDRNRVGRQYDGRPVLGLADAPTNVPVVLALPPQQALSVAHRCAEAGLRCISPPDTLQFGAGRMS